MFEISLSFNFVGFLIVFSITSHWFDLKFLLKAATLPPLTDIRRKSLTILPFKL